MLLSDFLKNGTMLQSKAGPVAIAANDLLTLGPGGALWSAQCADSAAVANSAATIIGSTTVVASYTAATSNRNAVAYDAANAVVYVAAPYLSGSIGLQLFKYSAAGTLLGSVIVDSLATAGQQTIAPAVLLLSNGNVAVVWQRTGNDLWYAVVDQNLNIVQAKVDVASFDPASGPARAVALTGGGFAVVYNEAATQIPKVTIASNVGAVVLAPTALTNNGAVSGNALNFAIAQLSNGNILIGIGSSAANKNLAYAILTAAGANVVQVTIALAVAAARSSGTVTVSASAAGFFCLGYSDQTNQWAGVYTNAAALQGAAYQDTAANTNFYVNPRLTNDGTNFWFQYPNGTTAVTTAYLPTAGAGYVTSALATPSGHAQQLECHYDRGVLASVGANGAYAGTINPNNSVLWGTLASQSLSSTVLGAKLGGDFSIISVSGGGSTTLLSFKYTNTAIVGVSRQTLAAGNAGTPLPFSMGPGGYVANAITGSIGKAFDHSSANYGGNKGVIFSNSVSLKGI